MFPFFLVACFFGGAFGIFVVSFLGSGRGAREVFPFLIFPQFFLAGVFNPIRNLPLILSILTYISPMRYAVDLLRGMYYTGTPDYSKTVLLNPWTNLVVIAAVGLVFLVVGTVRFVRKEQNR
jgi:ABC-2 type transport system permease protein